MNWFVHFFHNNEWLLKACPHVAKTVMCVWCKKDHTFKKRRTVLYFNALWFNKKPPCKENYLIPYVYNFFYFLFFFCIF